MIMLYINLFKKMKIIKDTGYIKCELILIGGMLYFSSIIFNIFTDYFSCASNIFLKHNGISIIITIFFLYIFTGYELGMSYEKVNNLNINLFLMNLNSNSLDNFDFNNNNKYSNTNTNINIEKELNAINSIYNIKDTHKSSKYNSNENINNNKNEQNIMKIINKKIYYIHSVHVEAIILHFFILSFLIFGIFYYNKYNNDNDIQERNKKWRYQCPLIKFDLLMNIIELIIINFMLFIIIKIWNYTYIFKYIKYIGFSLFIWVITGPLSDVIYNIK